MADLAQTLNTLLEMPTQDLQPQVHTALEFARLLNEARSLLRHFSSPELTDFERRCREQVGPIIEAKR